MNRLVEQLKAGEHAVRVLLVDDHAVVRMGMKALLSGDDRVVVVGEAATGAGAIEKCRELRPDVVILDLRLPDRPGFEVCREIRAAELAEKVIVMTSYADDQLVLESMKAGADGYLLKDAEDSDLAELIVRVALGAVVLDPKVARAVLGERKDGRAVSPAAESAVGGLSPQERRLMGFLAEGLSNKELGERMGLGDGTVRNYLTTIYSKLGLRGRTEAVAWWLRQARR